MKIECTRHKHSHISISLIDCYRFHKGYEQCDPFSHVSYPSKIDKHTLMVKKTEMNIGLPDGYMHLSQLL